jgi:hypothetical protein
MGIMRDYLIEGLPYRAIVKVDWVPKERLPRIAELGFEVLKRSGYDRDDPNRGKHHLYGDLSKPPRAVVMLIASQGIKELQLGDLPPVREGNQINKWLFTLSDEALHRLLQVCVVRDN